MFHKVILFPFSSVSYISSSCIIFFSFLLMLRCASHNSAHSYRSALFYRNVSQEGLQRLQKVILTVSKHDRLVMTELASSPLCVLLCACMCMDVRSEGVGCVRSLTYPRSGHLLFLSIEQGNNAPVKQTQ